ncbi:hypothetical protein LWF15_09385 [Kineosporia rhizophila]|uniref:calcium-binding protein n=1 Tax=Kineosporia TaxID=49184 RepID=UPI001E3B9BB5|nr:MULTISPECIES: calcium-binding protein [Kineosporia]MCE0535725.1 hypothetical protein [Kineosporia rhizophila]GLY17625.1 hypothetical protein Kisp01_46390 [Kineosporia sp. NBRC 101677]
MTLTRNRRVLVGAAAAASVLAAGAAAVAFSGSATAAEPAAAKPATVTVDGNELRYQAAPGQVNKLVVTRSSEGVENDTSPFGTSKYTWVFDDSVEIEGAADLCTYPQASDRTLIRCSLVVEHTQSPGYVSTIKLGDKNDSVKYVNDNSGGYEADVFHLGAGNDVYSSKGTKDGSRIEGGNGNDTITTGRAAGDQSSVQGGNGNDTIRLGREYLGADGGAGNDKIYGQAAADWLDGGAGNDSIWGGAGRDTIEGGAGNDKLYGQGGADWIYGQGGNDKLYGGPGADVLRGGPGKNVVKQ